jgi:hypothetical protein
MSGGPAVLADTPDQQQPPVAGQPGINVGHEDLQWVKTASPPHSEVFLLIKHHRRRVINALAQYN